jgi:hypothetical protein
VLCVCVCLHAYGRRRKYGQSVGCLFTPWPYGHVLMAGHCVLQHATEMHNMRSECVCEAHTARSPVSPRLCVTIPTRLHTRHERRARDRAAEAQALQCLEDAPAQTSASTHGDIAALHSHMSTNELAVLPTHSLARDGSKVKTA